MNSVRTGCDTTLRTVETFTPGAIRHYAPLETFTPGAKHHYAPVETFRAGAKRVLAPGETFRAGAKRVLAPGETFRAGAKRRFTLAWTLGPGAKRRFAPGAKMIFKDLDEFCEMRRFYRLCLCLDLTCIGSNMMRTDMQLAFLRREEMKNE